MSEYEHARMRAKSISKYLDVEDLDPDYGLWDGTPKVKNTNHLKKNYETLCGRDKKREKEMYDNYKKLLKVARRASERDPIEFD